MRPLPTSWNIGGTSGAKSDPAQPTVYLIRRGSRLCAPAPRIRNLCARRRDAVTSLRFVEGAVSVNDQDKTAENIDLHDPRIVDSIDRYWRKNMLIMFLLLIIWAVVGLGCGVLLADRLNNFSLGGFPLGFWFAQQGSILVFILLILAYSVLLNRLDAQHAQELQQYRQENADGKGADS